VWNFEEAGHLPSGNAVWLTQLQRGRVFFLLHDSIDPHETTKGQQRCVAILLAHSLGLVSPWSNY
jgi:hypothetical protein